MYVLVFLANVGQLDVVPSFWCAVFHAKRIVCHKHQQHATTCNKKQQKTKEPLSSSATKNIPKDFSAATSFKLDEITTASLQRGALRRRAGRTMGSGHVTAAGSSSKGTGGASRGAATQGAGGGVGGTQVRFRRQVVYHGQYAGSRLLCVEPGRETYIARVQGERPFPLVFKGAKSVPTNPNSTSACVHAASNNESAPLFSIRQQTTDLTDRSVWCSRVVVSPRLTDPRAGGLRRIRRKQREPRALVRQPRSGARLPRRRR